MKKTASIIIAVIIALTAICTVSVMAFAKTIEVTEAPTTTAAAAATSASTTKADPTNAKNTTTTAAASSSKSAAELIADLSSAVDKITTTLPNKVTEDNGDVVTNPSGVTAVDDSGDATTKAAVSSTKKAAAPVSSRVPNTGSSVAVPAIAVLALLAGTVAVVKTKKNED